LPMVGTNASGAPETARRSSAMSRTTIMRG
jgi:hypothetical protein